MTETRNDLGYGGIFLFWYPLALTWLMMAAEGPFLAAVVARMPQPKENLAAYGIALAVAILVEAPIIMMLSAATALVRDRDSFLKLRAFTHALNAAITLAMALLLFSGAMDFICRAWIGLSGTVTLRVHSTLVLLLPWPGAIGYRRFYQGVLIRSGLTRRVAYGTVVRLCSMATCALLLYRYSALHGADTAAAALSAGVVMEAGAARLMARSARRRLLRAAPAPTPANGLLTYRAIARFYYPLALTTLLSLGIHPVVTFFIGNSRSSLESLAVLPVIGSLVFIFRSLGLAYQEVVIALIGDDHEGYASLHSFAILLSLGLAVGLSLIAWTPLAEVWFRVISGLSPELAAFALTPTRILSVIPGLTALLSFQRAVMVMRNATNGITWATIIEVGLVVVVMWLSISYLDAIGVVAAAAALLIGRIGANLYLAPAMKERGVRRGA